MSNRAKLGFPPLLGRSPHVKTRETRPFDPLGLLGLCQSGRNLAFWALGPLPPGSREDGAVRSARFACQPSCAMRRGRAIREACAVRESGSLRLVRRDGRIALSRHAAHRAYSVASELLELLAPLLLVLEDGPGDGSGSGSGVGAGEPSEMVMVTVAPFSTLVPLVGFWLMTLPAP